MIPSAWSKGMIEAAAKRAMADAEKRPEGWFNSQGPVPKWLEKIADEAVNGPNSPALNALHFGASTLHESTDSRLRSLEDAVKRLTLESQSAASKDDALYLTHRIIDNTEVLDRLVAAMSTSKARLDRIEIAVFPPAAQIVRGLRECVDCGFKFGSFDAKVQHYREGCGDKSEHPYAALWDKIEALPSGTRIDLKTGKVTRPGWIARARAALNGDPVVHSVARSLCLVAFGFCGSFCVRRLPDLMAAFS